MFRCGYDRHYLPSPPDAAERLGTSFERLDRSQGSVHEATSRGKAICSDDEIASAFDLRPSRFSCPAFGPAWLGIDFSPLRRAYPHLGHAAMPAPPDRQ